MTTNFHKATQEEDNHHAGIMNELNDVISGKMDPKDLYKTMKTDDDHYDVNEMLQHGHLNKTRTSVMKNELHKLLDRNKFYMEKINQVDKMTNKLKGIHGDKMNEDTEHNLVKELQNIDKKRDNENDKGLGSLQEKDDMKNMKLGSKLKPSLKEKERERESKLEEIEEREREHSAANSRYSTIYTD